MESQVYYTSLGNTWDPGDQIIHLFQGFPNGSASKESACNAGDTGDMGLISGSGRSPDRENDNPLQYSCLENSMNRGTWRATVQKGHKELDTTQQLNNNKDFYQGRDLKLLMETKTYKT